MAERINSPKQQDEVAPTKFRWNLSDNNSVFNRRPTLRQITHGKFPNFRSEKDAKKFEKSYTNSMEQAKQIINQLVSPTEQEEWLSTIDSVDSLDRAWEVIGMVNAISYEDWQNRITSVDSYVPGDEYRFICHSVFGNPEQLRSEMLSDRYVSCSLLTNHNTTTFNSGYGFIFSSKDIVAAYPSDVYSNNRATNDEELFESGYFKYQIPIINTIDTIERETEDGDYSEIIIRKPSEAIGIFAFGNENYNKALILKRANPDLKIIELPTSSGDNIYGINRHFNS